MRARSLDGVGHESFGVEPDGIVGGQPNPSFFPAGRSSAVQPCRVRGHPNHAAELGRTARDSSPIGRRAIPLGMMPRVMLPPDRPLAPGRDEALESGFDEGVLGPSHPLGFSGRGCGISHRRYSPSP